MTAVAGKNISGYCSNLCISDFRNKATIEDRVIVAPKMGTIKPSVEFTVIFTAYFYVQTIKGTARFSGININKEATHLYLARWRPTISNLDGDGEHFLRSKGKLYRVLEITNVNESDDFILFQCTERGIESKQETHA